MKPIFTAAETRRASPVKGRSGRSGLLGSESNSLKRVLFVSYAFPPTGGGGVQRSVKFTRYLPQFGWCPTVLTVANPSVPVVDRDLVSDVGPGLSIVRARTFEPSYRLKDRVSSVQKETRWSWKRSARSIGMQLLQPDPQRLWNPAAYRAARKHLRQIPHEAIFVTGPPFSSFLLGRKLKRLTGLPLILDFRDEWLLSVTHLDNYRIGNWSKRRQQSMLASVLRAADAVIATTHSSAAQLRDECERVGSNATVQCIYNGFDAADIPAPAISPTKSHRLQITYTGTLWQLTDIQPVVTALELLSRRSPTEAARCALVLAGRRTREQQRKLQALRELPVEVRTQDYLPHRESLALAASSDLLLLLLSSDPGAERVVPAKVFEYMALKKPILAICPEGETSRLLEDYPHAHVFRPEQIDAMSEWLYDRLLLHSVTEGVAVMPTSAGHLKRFSREHLTEQLALTFNSTVLKPDHFR